MDADAVIDDSNFHFMALGPILSASINLLRTAMLNDISHNLADGICKGILQFSLLMARQ